MQEKHENIYTQSTLLLENDAPTNHAKSLFRQSFQPSHRHLKKSIMRVKTRLAENAHFFR